MPFFQPEGLAGRIASAPMPRSELADQLLRFVATREGMVEPLLLLLGLGSEELNITSIRIENDIVRMWDRLRLGYPAW